MKETREARRTGINRDQLITIDDLETFREKLLNDLNLLLKEAQNQPSKRWLKSAEVRRILDIAPGTLQSMRDSGVIKFMKIGGTLYYDQGDIEVMFEKNKVDNDRAR
ncbi:helix-turn-helix domain-containing protein [Taibaiella chishuiensis]|uniref:Helix-turn-helix protein n=1 Tax=Taibaiella chishuiensis TaxID=1434707 RepID=A0A2P8D0L9_9BACT|nr:helix-turn-helix domain-containing protein [Taibaiella chishuiensis]PSK90772.1 helix-turn-helix protein [Taibaiella chishuiensis]